MVLHAVRSKNGCIVKLCIICYCEMQSYISIERNRERKKYSIFVLLFCYSGQTLQENCIQLHKNYII